MKSESVKQILQGKVTRNCRFGLKDSQDADAPMKRTSAELLQLYRNSAYEGLTGNLSFDEFGLRKNSEIGLYKIELKTPLKKASPGVGQVGIGLLFFIKTYNLFRSGFIRVRRDQ